MVHPHGRFAWYELMTTDVEAAKAFYAGVMGWSAWDASAPGRAYALFTTAKAAAGGVMALPAEARSMGATPGWVGYVGVDDVDATAARIEGLGGVVVVPPTSVPNISRFSVFDDPQGVRLALFKWLSPGQPPPAEQGAAGHVGWHELIAADWEAALSFYSALLGWQKADADVEEIGTYQLFAAAGETIGGMVTKSPAMPAPFWLYYFNVSDIDAAAERVRAGGGQILDGPVDVPAGSWIVRCSDPQGAVFALEGMRARTTVGYFERGASGKLADPRGRRWSW